MAPTPPVESTILFGKDSSGGSRLLARFTSRSKKFYRDPGTIHARVYQVSSPCDRFSSGYDVEDREVHRPPPNFG